VTIVKVLVLRGYAARAKCVHCEGFWFCVDTLLGRNVTIVKALVLRGYAAKTDSTEV
jgi:hypothetical protein